MKRIIGIAVIIVVCLCLGISLGASSFVETLVVK